MTPFILGHRGASAYAPENTLIAFERAFELGADGIELDVTLTQDGIPIVIHDDWVDRTTNGTGRVSDMTLEEIRQLDAGGWFNEKFQGEKIPTLEEVLTRVPADKILNVELKTRMLRSWTTTATRLRFPQHVKMSVDMVRRLWEPSELERTVVRVIEQTRITNRVIVSSFNPIALYRVMKLSATLTRGLLYFKELPFFLGRAWLRPLARPHALHPSSTTLTGSLAQWAHARGYQINTWTVDDPAEAKRIAALGANGIITNKPDILHAALKSQGH